MLIQLGELSLKQFQLVSPHRIVPLHAMVSSVGYCEERGASYDWDGLRRGQSPFTLFQWTISGRGQLDFEGQEFEVLPGQAMLLPIPHAHRYYLPRNASHWRFLYVCIYGREAMRLFDEYRSFGPIWDLPLESAPVQTALRIHRDASAGTLNNPFAASASAYEMLMSLGTEKYFPKSKTSDRFVAVRAHVERHFAEDLDVEKLAEIAGMSRFHFTRQFTLTEGSGPGEYLLQVRVKNAARLLGNPKLSIKEVSARSGFSNANYLSKVFRRVLGISPREFRRSGMYSTRLR